jgi:hypothetical protein
MSLFYRARKIRDLPTVLNFMYLNVNVRKDIVGNFDKHRNCTIVYLICIMPERRSVSIFGEFNIKFIWMGYVLESLQLRSFILPIFFKF